MLSVICTKDFFFVLSVRIEPFMLSVIMLSVIMMNVIMVNVVAPSAIMGD